MLLKFIRSGRVGSGHRNLTRVQLWRKASANAHGAWTLQIDRRTSLFWYQSTLSRTWHYQQDDMLEALCTIVSSLDCITM